ncbi:MAG: DUF1707 SHOCT-like domain-containing protein [Propionibacteriaceae bacterium]
MNASGSVPQRIGDAERDAAVAALQDHHVAGRLDRNEFEERMAAALAARTRDDLHPLFVDLPRPTAAATSPQAAVAVAPTPAVPAPWVRYGAPAVASAIWPLTILACILLQNWSLIAVAIVFSMVVGQGTGRGCGGRPTHLQRR